MSVEPDPFDLDAAMLRRSEGELRAFMQALAVRLEGALPGRVSVVRRRDGLLSKTSHVAKIDVTCEHTVLGLAFGKTQLSATRSKLVRGVAISTSTVPVPEWLAEIRKEVQGLADRANSASDGLHDFL